MKKISLHRIDAYAMHNFRNLTYMQGHFCFCHQTGNFVIIGNKCCALTTITCTVHSGQFCFWHQTGKIVVSSNCHAPISNSTYMVIFASAALIAFFFSITMMYTFAHYNWAYNNMIKKIINDNTSQHKLQTLLC